MVKSIDQALRHPTSDPLGFCLLSCIVVIISLGVIAYADVSRTTALWLLAFDMMLMVAVWGPLLTIYYLRKHRQARS